MRAIFKRELHSYFTSPLGYVFIATYLAFSGFAFSYFTVISTIGGDTADVSSYFTALIFGFALLLPLLTMRSFSDDRRMKTEQLLLTSPVTLPGMVAAKFLAAFVVFGATYVVSCFNFSVLYIYKSQAEVLTEQNSAILFGNSIAVLLLGAAFIAIGIFISSLTEHQMTAAIATIAILLFCLCCNFLNDYITFYPVRAVCNWISIFSRFQAFTYGYFDINAVIYYISIVVAFLFLTVRIYEKRRWE